MEYKVFISVCVESVSVCLNKGGVETEQGISYLWDEPHKNHENGGYDED